MALLIFKPICVECLIAYCMDFAVAGGLWNDAYINIVGKIVENYRHIVNTSIVKSFSLAILVTINSVIFTSLSLIINI